MTSPVLDWRANLERDLHAAGLPRRVAVQLSNDAQAEADDAGRDPADLYGPASAYAAALARSVRATEPARTAGLNRPSPDLTGPVVLRVTEVSKRYGRRLVLSPVSFTLRAGQIAAIVGANGSGKSTLLDICAGATRASTGRVADGAPRVRAPARRPRSPAHGR